MGAKTFNKILPRQGGHPHILQRPPFRVGGEAPRMLMSTHSRLLHTSSLFMSNIIIISSIIIIIIIIISKYL